MSTSTAVTGLRARVWIKYFGLLAILGLATLILASIIGRRLPFQSEG